MKPTKHIEALAQKLHTQDVKASKYPTGANWYTEELCRIKSALLKGRFYVGVGSVAKSGMSRTLILAYIQDNKLHRICDNQLLSLAGCNSEGRIGGGGMDMRFQAQYNLFHSLYPNYKAARYQKRMSTYNSL